MTLTSNVIRAGIVFILLLIGGTAGYALIEGWTFLESFYMTVITISTVGYGEIRPLSAGGQLFTSVLILLGVGNLAYSAARVAEALLEKPLIAERRNRMEIRRMQRHMIVCGYGRVGATVASLLRANGADAVIIERDPAVCERLRQIKLPHVEGDATDDETLEEAGVRRARSLATCLSGDADNLFVALTARRLNPALTVITRASEDKNSSKMLDAGATRVVNVYRHGARLMAQQLLQPNVTDFIDGVSQWGSAGLTLEEIPLHEHSSLVGVPLREAPIRREMNVIVVGLRRATEFVFNPSGDHRLEPEDILIALGEDQNLKRLADLASRAG